MAISAVETMSAILKEEPPDLAETNRNVSPALERIVRHCLEKNPAERFQSARDVAFNLEALTDISSSSRGGVRAIPEEKSTRRWLVPARRRIAVARLVGGDLSIRASHRRRQQSDFPRNHFSQWHDLGRALCARWADHRLWRRLGRPAPGNFLHPLRQF